MSGPRAQGRKPRHDHTAAQKAHDATTALLARDTGRPRPEWMQDPALLPRKPPTRRPDHG